MPLSAKRVAVCYDRLTIFEPNFEPNKERDVKLAVFSDIHGNLTALEAVLADLATVGEVDQIWCLGDLAAFGPRPQECVARVRALKEQHGDKKFRVIGGNTDRYLVTGERFKIPPSKDASAFATYTAGLPSRDDILNWNVAQLDWENYEFLKGILGREIGTHVEGFGTIIGYHAIPGDDESMALKPDTLDEEAADALLDRQGRLGIGGHTHLQMDRELGNWRAINVGAVGLAFDQRGMACWGLFTVEDGDLTVDLRAVAYDIAALQADLADSGHPHPEWLLEKVKV